MTIFVWNWLAKPEADVNNFGKNFLLQNASQIFINIAAANGLRHILCGLQNETNFVNQILYAFEVLKTNILFRIMSYVEVVKISMVSLLVLRVRFNLLTSSSS